VTVLGAVTDDGDSFYCWTEENLTRVHVIRLLEALKDKFGEELVVFLDRAGYFYARDLWEHVSGERETETVGDSSVSCVCRDNLILAGLLGFIYIVIRRIIEILPPEVLP